MSGPWPFGTWEIDILGPFSIAAVQKKFIVVDVDYITKWVEAKALASITKKKTNGIISLEVYFVQIL